MKTDVELVAELVNTPSHCAFALIVERYVDLVYAAARRQAGAFHAEDITQAVFLLLWEHPTRVRDGSRLAGWLLNATRYSALQVMRGEGRRRRRESVAARQRSLISEVAVTESDDDLFPALDAALASLSDAERAAVAMRYLQDKSIGEVAGTIGISENTASKRVSRGLDHLRRILGRQGELAMPASLGPALVELGRQTIAPAGLATRVIAGAAVMPMPAAACAAKGAGFLFVHKIASVVAALALAATIVTSAIVAGRFSPAMARAADTPAATAPSSNGPASNGLIKVGVVVSALTAETKNPSGTLWGYNGQLRVVRDLSGPDVQLFPVIEPGTGDNKDQAVQLKRYFPDRTPIDGGDAAALGHLDVIVSCDEWMAPDAMLAGLDKAVSGGVGLVNIGGLGWATPGLRGSNPATRRLSGLAEAQGGYTDGPVRCDVLQQNAVLGSLGNNAVISLKPLGAYGILPPDATPLIKVPDMMVIKTRGPAISNPKFAFYPLYLSHLEKGRIVGIIFSPFALPKDPDRSSLVLRGTKWAAGIAVDQGL